MTDLEEEQPHHQPENWKQRWRNRLLGDPDLYPIKPMFIPSCPWRKQERKLTFYTKGKKRSPGHIQMQRVLTAVETWLSSL